MAMTNKNDFIIRLAWLEHKMVQVLWTIVSVSSALIGWLVANTTMEHRYGVSWFAVFVVTWIGVGFVMQRATFKGAPTHIQFIDP
jgi:uncharacterized membrane protein